MWEVWLLILIATVHIYMYLKARDTEFNDRALVGGLIFVAISTRPDICFAVSLLTQAFSAPTDLHINTAMRCLAYLSGTSSYGISLGGQCLRP